MDMFQVTDREANAAKKFVGAKLRKLAKTDDVRDIELDKLEWGQLNRLQNDLGKLAGDVMDKWDKAGDDDSGDHERAYDALTALYDHIDVVKDQRANPRTFLMGRDTDGETNEVETYALAPEQRMADYVRRQGRDDPEYAGLSLGQYLRSMVVGAKNDVERRALSEGSDSAGGFTTPEILSAELIDLLRARAVTIAAGARTVPLATDQSHIARIATDPVPAWRLENAAVADSDPTFDRVTFEPKSLAVLVKVSRELLEDSLNVKTELPRVIAEALALELDRVVFLGAAANDEPVGLDNITGVQASAHDAAIASFSPLVQGRRLLMNSNVPTVSAWVMHPDADSAFGELADTTGQPLQHPAILDRPDPFRVLTTTQLPTDGGAGSDETTIYGGDWSLFAVGMRSAVRIEVLRERFSDNLQVGFLAWLRADIAAIREEAFVRITGVQV